MRGKPAENEPYPAEILTIQRMPYGLNGFRRFAKLLGLKIYPFQAFMLAYYFAGVRELVILISKKNGKTTLLAAVALYHLLMVKAAECVIGASSRDQATILFNQADKMITDAALERRALPGDRREPTRYTGVFEVRSGYRVIKFEQGRIRVLAPDADTADGVIPTLAIVDELHRHPSGALYGVFRDGLLGDAQMITISTAGASMDSPLGHLLTRAREFAVEKVKKCSTYTSPDGSFVLVEWALDPEDDPHDLKLVTQVNPAPWHTRDTLKQRRDSPSTSRGQWLRFACGIWTEGDEPAITADMWDRLEVEIGRVEEGEDVFVAPSVGHNAAVAIAAPRPDGCVAVTVEHLEADEGRSIRARTEDLVVDLCERYAVQAVACDLRGFRRSVEILEARGVPVVEAPHTTPRLVEFSATLDDLMAEEKLMHDGDPATRRQMLAALKKTNEAGERYIPSDAARAVIAVAAAVHHATALAPEPLIMILPSVRGLG